MQFKDAEAARDIDAACMKLECEKSFMHKHHKWLVAMVNYEFNMNLLPHENEFKRITCNR